MEQVLIKIEELLATSHRYLLLPEARDSETKLERINLNTILWKKSQFKKIQMGIMIRQNQNYYRVAVWVTIQTKKAIYYQTNSKLKISSNNNKTIFLQNRTQPKNITISTKAKNYPRKQQNTTNNKTPSNSLKCNPILNPISTPNNQNKHYNLSENRNTTVLRKHFNNKN